MRLNNYCDVKNYIELIGFTLLSENYINTNEKLQIKCKNDHVFESRYYSFKQGKHCPVCAGVKKFTIDYVKEYIESYGYSLISNQYINANSRITVQCNSGHDYQTTFSVFKNHGKRCPVCYGNNKFSVKDVRKLFTDNGYTVISGNIENTKSDLVVQCDKGHEYNTTYNVFQRGFRCPECCRLDRSHDYEFIKETVEKEGYTLISDTYKSMKKIDLICPKNHKWSVLFSNFHSMDTRCPHCFKRFSRSEKELTNFVKSIYQDEVIENDKTQIINPGTGRNLELDIWLPVHMKAIEYNGEMWHKNEERDKLKKRLCDEKHIKLIVVYHSDWKKNRNGEESKVRKFIGD